MGRVQKEKGESKLCLKKLGNITGCIQGLASLSIRTCDGVKDEAGSLPIPETAKSGLLLEV